MTNWEVGHDGPSRPIIITPDHRMLSISQYENGRWVSYAEEENDCKLVVDAINHFETQVAIAKKYEAPAIDETRLRNLDGRHPIG